MSLIDRPDANEAGFVAFATRRLLNVAHALELCAVDDDERRDEVRHLAEMLRLLVHMTTDRMAPFGPGEPAADVAAWLERESDVLLAWASELPHFVEDAAGRMYVRPRDGEEFGEAIW